MNVQKLVREFKEKYKREPQAWEISVHEERCGCNKCPLYFNHPDYNKFEIATSDPDQKCHFPKSVRKQIGIYFKLKNLGLTEKEFKRHQSWANLPESVKQERIDKLKQNNPFSRLKKKRCGLTQLKPTHSSYAQQTDTKTPGNTTGTGHQETLQRCFDQEGKE